NTATRANRAGTPTQRSRITSALSALVMAGVLSSPRLPQWAVLSSHPDKILAACASGCPGERGVTDGLQRSAGRADSPSPGRKRGVEEKKMFGGVGFLLNGNMPVGTPHAFKYENGKAARMLIAVAPAGREKMVFGFGVSLPEGATTALPPTQEE